MKNILPVGVQVYSVRGYAERDFKGTMQKIKEFGYDGVELAGLYGLSSEFIRETLDEIGLVAISAHVPFAEMKSDPAGTIETYKKIGCEYLAVPYLEENDRPLAPAYSETLKEIRHFGELCTADGLVLMYHNHDFEFVKMPNGKYGLDDMYDTIPAEFLQTELDTCWVKVAGEDPAEYICKYSGRCPVVHLKDFYKEGAPANMYELIGIETEKKAETGLFEFRPVGYGMQDFPPILEASVESGAKWVIVEQDSSNGRTPLEAIKLSREYLKSLGW